MKKAGSLDREKLLKAIESGVSIEGPAGTVTIEPKTHHASLDIKVMEVKGQKLTIKQSSSSARRATPRRSAICRRTRTRTSSSR